MTDASPARYAVCRYCGVLAQSLGHANIGECIGALECEMALLRDHLRRRGTMPSTFPPPAPVGPGGDGVHDQRGRESCKE